MVQKEVMVRTGFRNIVPEIRRASSSLAHINFHTCKFTECGRKKNKELETDRIMTAQREKEK
jgi:hypothetical protein